MAKKKQEPKPLTGIAAINALMGYKEINPRSAVNEVFKRRRKVNPVLEAKRQEVLKAHRAATAKIARNEKKGVKVSGSDFDIRRDIAKVKRYNMQQLNAYLYELMGFTDRKTQFVAGSQGAPLDKKTWETYKNREATVNNIGEAHEAAIGDIFIPYSGMTIKERQAMFHELSRFDRDTPKPYNKYERQAKNITSQKSLELLLEQMTKRSYKDATINKSVKLTRKNFKKILVELGAGDLAKRVNSLTIGQSDILFNYSPFADIIARAYGDWKDYRKGGKEAEMAGVVNDQRTDIEEILDWAKTLPRKAG